MGIFDNIFNFYELLMSSTDKPEDGADDDGYVAPKEVDLKTIMSTDAEDESLKKYKEALLGAAAKGDIPAPADDPRRVVIQSMRVIFEDHDDVEYDLSSPEQLAAMKDKPFVMKAGCKYKIEIKFRVQHDVVSGLKYVSKVYWKGPIAVDTTKQMLGSYGPQHEAHVVTLPQHGWDECPSSCHAFKAKTTFTDDDKKKHLEYEWRFSIKKDWE